MIRTTLLGCALVATVLSTAALAQEPTDQRTYFTFSAPFQLPGGKTLPAGKYTFRIVDSPSNRHIVQILNESGTEMHTTLLAIPAQRQDPADEPEIRFMEAPANMPPAIKTWWYPGRSIGHEFIYPKEQARRLAALQPEPVLSVAGNETTAEEMDDAELTRIGRTGAETAADTTRTDTDVTADRSRETSTTAVAQQPAPPAPPSRTEQAPAPRPETARVEQPRTELPRTATALPMVGLFGLLSLGVAAAIRGLRRA
jgi:hypothetical protein